MKISVSEIPSEGLDVQCEVGLETDTPLKAFIKVRVEKADSDVYVRGDVKARLDFMCSRCLKEFSSDVQVPIDLCYRPVGKLTEDEKYELRGDELDMGFFSMDEIDIEDITREQVLLNIPMKPLCRETCKGICPKCGANLNDGTCGCSSVPVDGRMEKLEDYLKGKKE